MKRDKEEAAGDEAVPARSHSKRPQFQSDSDSDSFSLSSVSSGANDDPPMSELVSTAKGVVAKLQTMGENVLMNSLVQKNGPREATVCRILEVLFLLDVAKVEDHRGRDSRPSRAYTYRTGYKLEAPIDIADIQLRLDMASAKSSLTETPNRFPEYS